MKTLNDVKSELTEIVKKYNATKAKYCSQVLPNSYRYAKRCAWLELCEGKVVEVDGFAKKAPYGTATQYLIEVPEEHIDE